MHVQDALLRDWSKLTVDARLELQNHLLQHVVRRDCNAGTEGLKPFVRAQVSLVSLCLHLLHSVPGPLRPLRCPPFPDSTRPPPCSCPGAPEYDRAGAAVLCGHREAWLAGRAAQPLSGPAQLHRGKPRRIGAPCPAAAAAAAAAAEEPASPPLSPPFSAAAA